MRKELAKTYDAQIVEDRLYAFWMERGYFKAEPDDKKEPYTIVIPPPNVTSQLHIGHTFEDTIQDALIRWKRMQGYNALWLPGTDHASIATEVKVVERMLSEGVTKEMVGRDGFLKRAWEWKEEFGGRIVQQIKRIGASCDWSRERFTMDAGLNNAVLESFVQLYDKGLIYRGEKLINWCPHCMTTISDAEVEHEDLEGAFWHFQYIVKETGEKLTFATTRPETMLGDTALAVNPSDKRYAHLVGKTVTVPFVNRDIPVIADEYVEIEFGTGVVKITPAHDPNDFEVGARHNLPIINMMNDDGSVNENGAQFAGLDRFEARKRIVKEMDALGLFIKKETIKHAVGTHERCHKVVEPRIKLQWFVKMEPLAKPAIDAYKTGELNIIPDRFGKIYLNWLEGIHDWCISRQLWWGHRIPAYYCACGEVVVSKTAPASCPKCGGTCLQQDEDVLDTWFSSALWPFSTLGWPDKTADLDYFYPTSVLVTGYDLIFFWVIRMVFSGLEYTGKLPFKDVYFHGLVRDAQGKKMSKSAGNGVDPLELIEQFGADALRLMLITGNSAGNDMRFHIEKLEVSRNFTNKLWNATRFVLMNLGESDPQAAMDDLSAADKWILSRANALSTTVTEQMARYDIGMAAQEVYDFIWDEYCDWYIEMVKPCLYGGDAQAKNAVLWTLVEVLQIALKLLHPVMPFITEEIFTSIQSDEETIMRAAWPVFRDAYAFTKEESEIGLIKEAVRGIRNVRAEMNIPPSRKATVIVTSESEAVRAMFENGRAYMATLGYASELRIQADKTNVPEDAVSVVVPQAVIYMPFADLIDVAKEVERLTKEIAKLEKEVERVVSKLANQGFVAKAPANLIEEERAKEAKYRDMLAQTAAQLEKLQKM